MIPKQSALGNSQLQSGHLELLAQLQRSQPTLRGSPPQLVCDAEFEAGLGLPRDVGKQSAEPKLVGRASRSEFAQHGLDLK